MPAGYSGTPLYKKLGIKEFSRVKTVNAPETYLSLIDGVAASAVISSDLTAPVDVVHAFYTERRALENEIRDHIAAITPEGCLWVSWPKKLSKVPSDITEDVLREVALPLGIVDIKVCAVDAVWSALKFVIRKENRT